MNSWRPYEPCRENESAARYQRFLSDTDSFQSRALPDYVRPELYDALADYPQLKSAEFIRPQLKIK